MIRDKAVEKKIKMGKQVPWDKKRVRSVLTQAVLQGESIPKITKRLERVTGGDHKAAIRNARTMMTGVQNAGRTDAYDRANKMGIPVKKQWLATVDGRTRHWHRQLDGVVVDNDEPFENEIGKIMFPGDPEADGANIYNCRCTLLAAIKGFELDVTDPSVRPMPKLGDMSYEEWKASRKSESKPITGRKEGKTQIQGIAKGQNKASFVQQAESFEKQHYKDSTESGLLIKTDGKQILMGGVDHHVVGDKELLSEMSGALFTHNHPSHSTFSSNDVMNGIVKGNLNEMRAVTSAGDVHILINNGASIEERRKFNTFYAEVQKKFTRIANEKYKRGEIRNRAEYIEEQKEKWLIENAPKYSLEYKKKRLK